MGFGPQTKRVEGRSQATPFADDFLAFLSQQGGFGGMGGRSMPDISKMHPKDAIAALRGFHPGNPGGPAGGDGMSPSSFGMGMGPLQQEAGTAIRQLVNSGGGQAFDNTDMFAGMRSGFETALDRQGATLNQNFGDLGGRFSRGLADAQGSMRGQAEAAFSAQIGNILAQQHEARQNRLMQGIGMMQGMGDANINPFIQFAMAGIQPDQIIASPGMGSQFLQAAATVAGGAASRG